jgi:hypothetical protein
MKKGGLRLFPIFFSEQAALLGLLAQKSFEV